MRIRRKIAKAYDKLVRNSDWYQREMFLDCQKFWDGFPMGLDMINLGSTSAKYAFSYAEIDKKCANWAMEPQTLYADWLILQNYSSYLKPSSIVFISICPFSSLSTPRYLTKGADRYYTILAAESILPYSLEKFNRINEIKNQPKRYYPVRALKNDLKNAIFGKRKNGIEIPTDAFEEHSTNLIKGWKHEFSILNFEDPLRLHNLDLYNDAESILKEMIMYCIERQLRPIIVIPPATKHLTDKLPMSAREKYMYAFIKKANEANIPVLDYFEDERFQSDDFFYNSLCLNEEGAKIFTKQIIEDVEHEQ